MYFTMDSLNQVHFLYQYSLQMFLDIFSSVLFSNSNLDGITDYQARLAVVTSDLFTVSFKTQRSKYVSIDVIFQCILGLL